MNLSMILNGVIGRKVHPMLNPQKQQATGEDILMKALKLMSKNLHITLNSTMGKWKANTELIRQKELDLLLESVFHKSGLGLRQGFNKWAR